jgi:hypothetical protein
LQVRKKALESRSTKAFKALILNLQLPTRYDSYTREKNNKEFKMRNNQELSNFMEEREMLTVMAV